MAEVREGVSLTHAFKHHKGKKKAKGEKTVNASTFRKIMYSYNKKLAKRVLDGFHTQLPHHMGYIRVVGVKPVNLPIDWKETKEQGEIVHFDNRDTDGIMYKWDWQKPNHLVKNMQHFSFAPTDGNNGNSLREQLNTVLTTNPRAYKRYLVLKRKW